MFAGSQLSFSSLPLLLKSACERLSLMKLWDVTKIQFLNCKEDLSNLPTVLLVIYIITRENNLTSMPGPHKHLKVRARISNKFGHRRFQFSLGLAHGLINNTDTKAKCCHLNKLTCKGTLQQVFIRVLSVPLLTGKAVSETTNR